MTYRRIDQFGNNDTMNEGYAGATVTRPLSCDDIFATLTQDDLEGLDVRDLMRRRRK